MRIGRTVPPAAAPLCAADLWHGLAGMFARGHSLHSLEDEIRRHFGVRHVFLVSSGTAALTLTLMALRSLSQRTAVLIPAYTCPSVPAAVVKAGLRPVLCDIDPSTFDFDHALLEQALSAETLCVVAHHLFGIPSDIERIRALCAARDTFVVEDAAQAMGAEADGRALGTLGDVGIFSLGRGKNITCGSGGVIVTRSDQIAGAIDRRYRQIGVPTPAEVVKDLVQLALMAVFIRPRLYWIPAGLPFLRLGETIYPREISLRRLSGMKAGLLRNWRSRLARSNRLRAESAIYFSQRLSVPLRHGASHPYLRLPIVVASAEERERIRALSQERGLGLSIAYPTTVNEIPEIRNAFDGQRFPSAQSVAERLLTIPTHHWLRERDKRAIAECVGTAAGAVRPPDARRKAS
jgi:dTDP-4-amino-4,6-dideoxygalactose transaminase